MGKAKTEHELAAMRWRDDDVDEGDELHKHFEVLQDCGEIATWMDVADEGRRIWSRMFGEEIESYSAAEGVIGSVAAAGYALAIAHIAERLGVTACGIRCAIEREAVADADKFLQECREYGSPEYLAKIQEAARAHVEKEQE